jgi:hypothetical protein
LAASTPDVTGRVQFALTLADDAAGGDAAALADLLRTWIRAVELGFFGPAGIRLERPFETQGRTALAVAQCASVPWAAFCALSKMVARFSEAKSQSASASIIGDNGLYLGGDDGEAIPALPASIPFEVELAEDFHREVRVELEFRDAFGPAEEGDLVEAFAVWDALVAGLGDPAREPDGSEYETRRLNPAMIEHSVFGYIADEKCFDLVVLWGLRLHQHQAIERITFE